MSPFNQSRIGQDTPLMSLTMVVQEKKIISQVRTKKKGHIMKEVNHKKKIQLLIFLSN